MVMLRKAAAIMACLYGSTAQRSAQRGMKSRAQYVFQRPADLDDGKRGWGDPFYPTKQIYGQTCGKNSFDRIVGGELTTYEKNPWQVYLQIGWYQCGGSIISDKWVITAAHCVDGSSPMSVIVVHGLSDLPKPPKVINKAHWSDVASIHIHPKYDDFSNMYDVALIEMKWALDFNNPLHGWPICLPATDMCLGAGEKLTTSGWGATSEGGRTSTKLKQVEIPQVGATDCYMRFLKMGKMVTLKAMTCVGGEKGEDACQGDSGGPLTYKDSNGVHTLVGLVSWGVGCARDGVPGVYTRLTYMMEWIRSVSKIDNDGNDKNAFCDDRTTHLPHSQTSATKWPEIVFTTTKATTKATTTKATTRPTTRPKPTQKPKPTTTKPWWQKPPPTTTQKPKPTTTRPKPTTTQPKPISYGPTTTPAPQDLSGAFVNNQGKIFVRRSNLRCAIINSKGPMKNFQKIYFNRCNNLSGAKWVYNKDTHQIESQRVLNGHKFCWHGNFMMCQSHQANCFDWLKIMKCNVNDPMQRFNFTADSGAINMVEDPDKCVTFNQRWKLPGKLESCSEDTRFGVELQRGGSRSYKLEVPSFDRNGNENVVPIAEKQIQVVQKNIDFSKEPVRLCAGVPWKKRKRAPYNWQRVMVRHCGAAENWMDKFYYDSETEEVKDGRGGKTCWTYARLKKRGVKVVTYTCHKKKEKYQKWTHDSYTGAFCLKSFPHLCINSKHTKGSQFTVTASKVSAFGNL